MFVVKHREIFFSITTLYLFYKTLILAKKEGNNANPLRC